MSKKSKMVNSPIRWVGGKYKLRKQIIDMIPSHACYVEVFGGAAWVLLGKEPSSVEIYNDIDEELVNFFSVIKHQAPDFLDSFIWELASRAEFEKWKNADPKSLDPIQRAHRFYYLIMAGWGGELDYPRFQTSINDGGHGNRLIGALKTLEQRINPVYERLKTVIIENLDWQTCVERYDNDKVVMYLDPPYPDNNCNYAHNMKFYEEHQELSDWMKTAKSKLILSNYDKPEIKEIYKSFFMHPVNFASGMNYGDGSRRNQELLITNFKLTRNGKLTEFS